LEANNYTQVHMVREDLEHIPTSALEDTYSVRWYQPGDDRAWLDIHQEAYRDDPIHIGPDRHKLAFQEDVPALEQRQLFVCNQKGREIGTATAWYDKDEQGEEYGLVHWVAMRPKVQGQGLAKPVMTIILNRMRELGHQKAMLRTQSFRIPAIQLYLKFGFVPGIVNDADYKVWATIRSNLRPTSFDF